MRVVILEDYEAISEFAAQFVCNRINNFMSDSKNKELCFVMGLPTGKDFCLTNLLAFFRKFPIEDVQKINTNV